MRTQIKNLSGSVFITSGPDSRWLRIVTLCFTSNLVFPDDDVDPISVHIKPNGNPSRECASPIAARLDCSGFRRPFRMCRLAYAPADLFPLAHGALICDAISQRRRPHNKPHLSPIPPPREYAHHSVYSCVIHV